MTGRTETLITDFAAACKHPGWGISPKARLRGPFTPTPPLQGVRGKGSERNGHSRGAQGTGRSSRAPTGARYAVAELLTPGMNWVPRSRSSPRPSMIAPAAGTQTGDFCRCIVQHVIDAVIVN